MKLILTASHHLCSEHLQGLPAAPEDIQAKNSDHIALALSQVKHGTWPGKDRTNFVCLMSFDHGFAAYALESCELENKCCLETMIWPYPQSLLYSSRPHSMSLYSAKNRLHHLPQI